METIHVTEQASASPARGAKAVTKRSEVIPTLESPIYSLLNLSAAIANDGLITADLDGPREYDGDRVNSWALVLKRVADLLAAAFLLVSISPVLAACALSILLTSSGSIFYKQVRLGKDGRPFSMWKFRTMYEKSEQVLQRYLETHAEERRVWEERIKLERDPRVTSVGRLMRRFSLDELPQLWNVLIGEMSLIGPRPITICQMPRYGVELRLYSRVRPGLTGLWQISGRSTTSFETRVLCDKEYVQNWSLMLDFRIWLRTFGVVLTGAGAY